MHPDAAPRCGITDGIDDLVDIPKRNVRLPSPRVPG